MLGAQMAFWKVVAHPKLAMLEVTIALKIGNETFKPKGEEVVARVQFCYFSNLFKLF